MVIYCLIFSSNMTKGRNKNSEWVGKAKEVEIAMSRWEI